MKYLDEFRDGEAARLLASSIESAVTRPWTIMEVCGGQTHSILRYGLDLLLPPCVSLVHGPGCPVCVTPAGLIDSAAAIASRPEVILCSFGDMLRVPGSSSDLLSARADGADVRIVYSPIDAVRIAQSSPDRQVVFFAVGFETTVPVTATAVLQAEKLGLPNFSVLNAHVRVPPVLCTVLSSPSRAVQGILAAGHVCTVTGYREYEPIAESFSVPIVVTGFEPVDILTGIRRCLEMLESGTYSVENRYSRAVGRDGNISAQELISKVFKISDRDWRGLGLISEGGFSFVEHYSGYDAGERFPSPSCPTAETPGCMSALVLRGEMKPSDCPSFGRACTPEHPLGAPMVSSEGACAAYDRYRRVEP